MDEQKTSIAAFSAGAVLLALAVIGIPFNEGLLIFGSALASFAYAFLLLSWRGSLNAAKAAPASVTPPSPVGPITPTSPQAPPTPSTPQAATPTPGQPPEVRPPTKPPAIKIPQFVIENRIPIALLTIGLILVVAALAFLFGLQTALGYGLLIPGVIFLGIGSAILFLRLYRRPGVVELKRFCMHCGFQMSSADVYCGRCHRQPPSGVDTKVCPNCTAVVPALAKFCRECGAGQPSSSP